VNRFVDKDKRENTAQQNLLPHAIRKTPEKMFGKHEADSIIEDGCNLFGEPETKVLSNYILFSEMIGKMFDKHGKQHILEKVEKDLKGQGLI